MSNTILVTYKSRPTRISTTDIKTLSVISAEEQGRITQAYSTDKRKVDGTRFNTVIELANAPEPLRISETIEELKKMMPLVNLGNNKFVPANHIIAAAPLEKEEKDKLIAKGVKLQQSFRSAVDLSNGYVLSTATDKQVFERKHKAIAQGHDGIETMDNNKGVA